MGLAVLRPDISVLSEIHFRDDERAPSQADKLPVPDGRRLQGHSPSMRLKPATTLRESSAS